MIDWLFQNTIDTSVLILLVLIVRHPVRRIFGAHIAYGLWLLPFLKLFISVKFNRPEVMTKMIELPDSTALMPVYSGPMKTESHIITLIFVAWLVGLLIWSITKAINAYQFRLLINKNATLNEQINQPNQSKQVNIKVSQHVNGPLITGLVKPTIFVPDTFTQTYTPKQQQLILEHELMHAKRKDLWALCLAEIYRAVFWFNPLVHLAFSKFQQDQEFACDYQILKNADHQSRIDYGQALKQNLSAVLIPHSLTFFYHKHERFIMLSKHKTNKTLTFIGLFFGMAIAYPVFTETNVSLADKSVKSHGGIVSFDFNEIPLQDVVMLVSNASGGVKNFMGLEYLQNINITAKAKKVHAYDFLDELLEDNGLKVLRIGDTWQFSIL